MTGPVAKAKYWLKLLLNMQPGSLADRKTRAELATLIRLGTKYMHAGPDIHRHLQDGGVLVEPANFYSTVPLIRDIETAFEYQEPEPFGSPEIFRTAALREILAELAGFSQDFDPPLEGDSDSPGSYFWKNGMFSYSDAMSYYAMVRRVRPRTILEIGSGFSTLVALEALRRNGSGRIVCVEPFPSPWLRRLPGIELLEKPAQALPAAFFNETLADGDILFIDSTHTVKTGSDCLHLFLRVLPNLVRDLAVHVHDVFLPAGMPKSWGLELHRHWTEQHLLLAYLLGNGRTRMLFGSFFAKQSLPVELEALMRGRYPGGGGSFWFRQAPPGRAVPDRLLDFASGDRGDD